MKKVVLLFLGVFSVAGCAEVIGTGVPPENVAQTPTVDYISRVDPYGAEHKDPFLSQLVMNYRSYAVYNVEVAGIPDLGEMFAQKAVAAFSGETPAPESIENWNITDNEKKFELRSASQELQRQLAGDARIERPQLAAEAQAKFDCWLSASASGQTNTAAACRERFNNTILALNGNGGIIQGDKVADSVPVAEPTSGFAAADSYPEPAEIGLLTETGRTRESVVIVNNIMVPKDLIRPAPAAQPIVFNQNIYGGKGAGEATQVLPESDGTLGGELVSRDEFINMMMALRTEIQDINKRLDVKEAIDSAAPVEDVAMIKVVQIPAVEEDLDAKQRVMEEIFEVHFDFNKSEIKSEYQPVIQKLAATTRDNRNVKISIVGHTDTVGSDSYNYALGGRRAESVKQMLIANGVPASSIIVVSSGKNDLKVKTENNVKSEENRRVRVVKEQKFMDSAPEQVQGVQNLPQDPMPAEQQGVQTTRRTVVEEEFQVGTLDSLGVGEYEAVEGEGTSFDAFGSGA